MKTKSIHLLMAVAITLMAIFGSCQMLPSKSAFLTVEETSCLGCGDCIKVCEADAIILIGDKAVIDPSKCIQCGKCVKVCPYDAIH
jgi:ferredoxin